MDTMQIENVANPARDVEAIFSEIAQKNLKLIGFPPQVTLRHIKAAVLLRLNHCQTCDGVSRFYIADFVAHSAT